MTEREIVQSIQKLKDGQHTVNPSADWVSQNRTALMQHIARTTEDVSTRTVSLVHLWSALSLIMPQRTVYAVVRPAVIFVLCVSVGSAGWLTTVSASLNSLPGDALYPVKIATEHTQVAVVEAIQGDAASAELRLSFTSRRAEEVNKIIEAPGDAASKRVRVDEAVEHLKTNVQGVSDYLVAVQLDTPGAAVAVAKVIDRKVAEIEKTLLAADVRASNVDASVAVASTSVVVEQLKLEADRVKLAHSSASSTPVTSSSTMRIDFTLIISTSTPTVTTTPAIATSTNTIGGGPSSTPVIHINVRPIVRTPAIDPSAVATPQLPTLTPPENLIPERPTELAPDVVDTATPIRLESWEE